MAQIRAKLYFCYVNRASIVELRLTLLSVLGNTWSDAGMELADDPLYATKHADTKGTVKFSWKILNWSNYFFYKYSCLHHWYPGALAPGLLCCWSTTLVTHFNSFESSAAVQLVALIHAQKTFLNIAVTENFKWMDAFESLPRKYISFSAGSSFIHLSSLWIK